MARASPLISEEKGVRRERHERFCHAIQNVVILGEGYADMSPAGKHSGHLLPEGYFSTRNFIMES